MAATGGGKIRSRRYQIASKPYAKSKQQSGLISRVTDTVKSIVPSWLQKYFKNGDAPEGGEGGQRTDQSCLLPPPPPPPNGNEEGPPSFDGRDSPEPSTSNTEPSTSRASLNFQEYVLSRPPLSRSHLHFNPLDASSPTFGASSSLFSQPSTSSTPGPFSTSLSLVKEIKDNLSQHEDDNISTTSGFSSRASDKDVPTTKTASLPQLWSPETDRSISAPQPPQSSLKKPSFNLSVFGSSSNSTMNSTMLNSSQLGDSPFYPGKTTYGGAAAVRSARNRPRTPYQAPVRRQIKAKSAGAQPCGVTSATARRILQSLERMSSPLADAKRIPAAAAASPILSPSADGTRLDAGESSHQSKRKRMDSNLPPVQKLVIPAAAFGSGSRSVSFRPTLTPGGIGRTFDRTATEKTPSRQSQQLPDATPGPSQSTRSFSGPAYPQSSTPAAISVGSRTGKMKRERSTARPSTKRSEEDEVAEVPVLPSISLPINPSSLPTFSFSTLPPFTSSTSTSSAPKITAVTPTKEAATNKDLPKASTPPCAPFTFSSPIVKATAASPPSYSPSTGFTFSAPVAKLAPSLSMSNGNLATPSARPVKSVGSKSTEEFEGPFKPAKTLKQASVLDLLKSPGFASPVAPNSSEPNVAPQQTQTPSAAPVSTATTSSSSLPAPTEFVSLFKAPAGWSCEECLVQNKQSDTKCVCCAASKPNGSPKSTESKPSNSSAVGLESIGTSAAVTTTGFSPIFSKPAGTWECDTCMISNKPDVVKCVACETAKPGTGLKPSLTFSSAFSTVKTAPAPTNPISTGISGFGDRFQKPEGSWECQTCLVQNKAEDTKCVACKEAKPGATAEAASSTSSAPVFGFGDKFKKPEGSWECDVCLVQNKAADVKCVACQTAKPGAKVEPKALGSSVGGTTGTSIFGSSTSGGVKFGTSDSSSVTGGFKFGSSDSSSTSSGGFKFEASFGSASSESSSKDPSASSGFKFGSSSEGFKFGAAGDDKKSDQPSAGSGIKFGAFGTGSSSKESNSPKSGFTTGLSNPVEKPAETAAASSASPAVAFTLFPSQDKSDNAEPSKDTTPTNATATATAGKGSVFSRLGDPSLATSSAEVSSTFGSLQAGKETAAPIFTFGKPAEKKEASASPATSTFLFGGAGKDADPAPAATGGFSFGKVSAPTEQPPPTFTFGKPAEKSETSTSETPKPTFTFGQSAADPAAAPKPVFSFMAKNIEISTTNSTTSTPTSSLFGSAPTTAGSSTQAPASSSAPSTFVFGQQPVTTSEAPPTKAFVFGQSQDSQSSAPASTPLNSAPAQSQPFIFGAPANPAAPNFCFGATAPSAASSSAPSAAPAPFVFSSDPPAGFGTNQPAFGSSFGSPFTATPSQTPAFGANAAPVFGQQTNSTPVFGAAANSTSSGGFQFGGAGGFGATNNTNSGVFTFGAGAAAAPAPSTNSSIVPQPGAAAGGFNFSQTPAFNMGSTKSFAASPAAGRKIKTAVRRRK